MPYELAWVKVDDLLDFSRRAHIPRAAGGDLRHSITYLQSASRLSSSTNPPVPITPHDIQEVAGIVPTTVVDDSRTLSVPVIEDMGIDDLSAN
ncbi:hypothetical protein BD769DRAFT_1776615 [Suillus cothurnatus]|nr:hypothetical protein BD769DRAFT_1776615 [Suillus cothurnatus]